MIFSINHYTIGVVVFFFFVLIFCVGFWEMSLSPPKSLKEEQMKLKCLLRICIKSWSKTTKRSKIL